MPAADSVPLDRKITNNEIEPGYALLQYVIACRCRSSVCLLQGGRTRLQKHLGLLGDSGIVSVGNDFGSFYANLAVTCMDKLQFVYSCGAEYMYHSQVVSHRVLYARFAAR